MTRALVALTYLAWLAYAAIELLTGNPRPMFCFLAVIAVGFAAVQIRRERIARAGKLKTPRYQRRYRAGDTVSKRRGGRR